MPQKEVHNESDTTISSTLPAEQNSQCKHNQQRKLTFALTLGSTIGLHLATQSIDIEISVALHVILIAAGIIRMLLGHDVAGEVSDLLLSLLGEDASENTSADASEHAGASSAASDSTSPAAEPAPVEST